MSGYGIFCGDDGKSFIQPMQVSEGGLPSLTDLLPSAGWRPFHCPPGISSPLHSCPVAGLTVVVGGMMKISVRGGDIPSITLEKGDFILLFDVIGEGHATDTLGEHPLETISLSFPVEEWQQIQPCFTSWPAVVLPELVA